MGKTRILVFKLDAKSKCEAFLILSVFSPIRVYNKRSLLFMVGNWAGWVKFDMITANPG